MDFALWPLWLGAMIFFAIVEAATVNMVSIWFMGGSLAALVVSLCHGPWWLQLIAFFLVSGALLAALRPFVKKHVAPRKIATNADMAIGREAYVVETIDNLHGTGAVKLDGKTWTARSLDESILPEGALVRIVKLEGVKLYVEPARVPAGQEA